MPRSDERRVTSGEWPRVIATCPSEPAIPVSSSRWLSSSLCTCHRVLSPPAPHPHSLAHQVFLIAVLIANCAASQLHEDIVQRWSAHIDGVDRSTERLHESWNKLVTTTYFDAQRPIL